MPTANRRRFVPHAIEYFLRQDYLRRELVIIDDGDDAIQDLLPVDERIRYVRLVGRRSLGLKRNIACQHARGKFIVHWDDDDWMAGWRIRAQVEELRRTGADICGLDRLMYVDLSTGDAWQYAYQGRPGTWVAGNTFCYTRELWDRNPFISANVSEDTRFLRGGSPKVIAPLADTTICIGTIHPNNTSRKNTNSALWQRIPPERIRDLVGKDMAFFKAPALTH
jgi:glycosyltransferase involved in cell wall biosynthesis